MSRERVRIGMIGCGGFARHHHIKDMLTIPEAEIVALADSSPDSLATTVATFPTLGSVPQFADYRKMIDEVPLDGVVIVSPHTLHFEQAAYALEHNVSALVEKPMVMESAHARRLIELRDKRSLVLMVAYQRHYGEVYRAARELIQSGRMGKLLALEAWQCQQWKPAKDAPDSGWRLTPELSGGGYLSDSASHLLDILLWVTGERASEVFAFLDNRETRVDILSAISIRFANGGVGTITAVGETPKGYDEGMQFWMEGGRISIQGIDEPKLTVYDPDPRVIPTEPKVDFADRNRNFARAILGKELVQVPAECGLRVAELSEAIYASARSGQSMRVQTGA